MILTKLELAWFNKDKVLLGPPGYVEPVLDTQFNRWIGRRMR